MAIENKILTFGTGKVGTVGGNKLMGYIKPFDATEIPNCVQWLDNDINQFTLGAGNRVSQWRDKTTLNHHVNQATGIRQPVFNSGGINGQNGVYFNNGEDNFLDCVYSASYPMPFTTFTVWNIDNLSTRDSPTCFDVASGNRRILSWGSNNIRLFTTAFVNGYAKTRPFNLISNQIEWNGASSNITENGVFKSILNVSTNTLSSVRFGHFFFDVSPNINSRLSGYICEHIAYSRIITNDEKTAINTYLNSKYGL